MSGPPNFQLPRPAAATPENRFPRSPLARRRPMRATVPDRPDRRMP